MFYCMTILYFAFSIKYISLKHDISYGIYIWHMPIINAFLVYNFGNAALAIITSIIISLVSWLFVERPVLRLKRKSIRPI